MEGILLLDALLLKHSLEASSIRVTGGPVRLHTSLRQALRLVRSCDPPAWHGARHTDVFKKGWMNECEGNNAGVRGYLNKGMF